MLLSAVLFAFGLYILSNYLRALAWAVVLAIALWPLYERARRRTPRRLAGEVLPLLFTALVGFALLLPIAILAVEAIREIHGSVDYGRQVQQTGIPAPSFLAHLPYVGPAVTAWWTDHLSHAGWSNEIIHQVNTSSNRELGRNVGANTFRRVVLFGFSLLALFFLFREGETFSNQCFVVSEKLFGARGQLVARQMATSVHGTVNGLVFVGIGEGVLLGFVYFFTKVPHPILFGTLTAVAAMIPFAAAIAFLFAALILLGSGSVTAAGIVVVAGVVVTFTADHFVRPKLIGGATKLPFLWVLLGILGGVESFGLLGLFLGPAVMSALILLWRELANPPEPPPTP